MPGAPAPAIGEHHQEVARFQPLHDAAELGVIVLVELLDHAVVATDLGAVLDSIAGLKTDTSVPERSRSRAVTTLPPLCVGVEACRRIRGFRCCFLQRGRAVDEAEVPNLPIFFAM